MFARKTLSFCWALAFFLMSAGAAAAGTLADKKAVILDYLQALQTNRQTLSGVQVNEFEVYLDYTSVERLRERTGKTPAVLGLELMNAMVVPPYKDYLYARAAAQTSAGGLVALTWHERNPIGVCIRGEFFDCTQRRMTPETLNAVLTAGTPENAAWLKDVDAIAKVLKGFQDRGVVVLFRPYHEMNGGWFWWGKQDAYPKLWDALYDELVTRRGLRNMIWVWSSDRVTPDAARYTPIRHKPDVTGIDVYEDNHDSPVFAQGAANVRATFPSAPFALTEVGAIPSAKALDDMNPAWVLLWGGEYIDKTLVMKDPCANCNADADVDAFLKLPRFVSREEIPVRVRDAIAKGVQPLSPLAKNYQPQAH